MKVFDHQYTSLRWFFEYFKVVLSRDILEEPFVSYELELLKVFCHFSMYYKKYPFLNWIDKKILFLEYFFVDKSFL